MLAAGMVCVVAAVVCVWVFVAVTVREDNRSGGTSRVTRPSQRWLIAGVVLAAAGLLLIAAHVARLWAP